MQHNQLRSRCSLFVSGWALSLALLATQSANAADPVLLKGHAEVVYDAAFLPDGKSVVTASFDRTLKLWDLATLKPVRTMEGHTGIVLTVAVSADGNLIASGSNDNQIRLWDVPKSAPLTSLAAHEAAATAVAATADGKTLATADATGVVKFWDTMTGTAKLQVKLPTGVVLLDWRKDGQQLAAASASGVVWLLNLADGAITATFGTHPGEVTGLGFNPNNQLFTSGADGIVRRWPVQVTPTVVAKGHEDVIHSVAVNPNGSLIVTAGKDKTARVWNRADGAQARTLDGHGGEVTAVAYSRNSVQIATGCADKIARVFDGNSGMLVKAFAAMPGLITAVEISPDTQRLLVADDAGTVKLFQISDATELKTFAGHAGAVRSLAFWSNGTQIITGGVDKSVRVWTVETAQAVRKIDLDAAVTAIALANNDSALAVGTQNGIVRLINPADGAETTKLAAHTGEITGLDFGANLQQLASSSTDGRAIVWDLTTKLPRQFFVGHAGSVSRVRIHPDNLNVITAGADKTVRVEPIAVQFVKVADEKRINALAVSPNAAWYATASDDGTVKMFNAGDGAPIRAYSGFQGPVVSVTFSPNSQQIAAGGKDKTVRTWNPNNGIALFKLAVTTEAVRLGYSPDGLKLVAALADKTLPCFDPSPLNPQPVDPPHRDASQILVGHADALTGLAWLPDNRTLWTSSTDRSAKSWSIAAPSATATLAGHAGPVYGVAFTPDAKTVVSVSSDKTIRVWDVEKKAIVKVLATLPVAVNSVTISPDGKLVVAAVADNSVRLFDLGTGSEVRKLSGPTHPIYSVTMSRDGNFIAGAGMGIGSQRPVFVWNKDNSEPVATLTGHKDDIYRVQFNATGNRIWSLGYSGALKVWDVTTKQPVFESAMGVVSYSVALSPDGGRVVVSANDRLARILEVPANAK